MKTTFFDKFTPDQLKNQYKANLQTLTVMYEKAIATGKRVNGYTPLELQKLVLKYKILCEC